MSVLKDEIKALWVKHSALIKYAFFGGLTTLANISVYGVATYCGVAIAWANVLAWVLSVAFAYYTNRRWVFESTASGFQAVMREIGAFVACRLGTGILDQAIMMLVGAWLGAQLVPDDMLYLWSLGVKVASNVLVIVLNYVFSKVWVFRKAH